MPSNRKPTFKVGEQTKKQFGNTTIPNTTICIDIKNKAVTSKISQKSTKEIQCYKCHENGHFAYICLTRSLLIDKIHDYDDRGLDVVYDPQGDFTDADEDLKEFGTYLSG